MVEKQRSVAFKIALLKYLIDTKAWLLDSHPERFWDFIGDTFTAKAAPQGSPQLTGKELELLCQEEVDIWGTESDDPDTKRRRGHEAGSEYDLLMRKWVDVWDSMMIEYWRMEVSQPENFRKFDIIPPIWREGVEKLIKESQSEKATDKTSSRTEQGRTRSMEASKIANKTPPEAPATVPPTAPQKPQELDGFAYDVPTLRRVVESAKARAIEQGKKELGHAVQQIFEDSLANVVLRRLLEKILLHQADQRENAQFQEYVKLAKRKLKDAKIDAAREAKRVSRPVPYQRTTLPKNSEKAPEEKGRAEKPRTIAPKPNGTPRQIKNAAEIDGQVVASQQSNSAEGKKRKRESQILEELKEAAAQRASKQARLSDSHGIGSSRPKPDTRASDKRSEHLSRQVDVTSLASSPLSSHGETDVEAAKEAYMVEVGSRRPAPASNGNVGAESLATKSVPVSGSDGLAAETPSITSKELPRVRHMEEQAASGAEQDTMDRRALESAAKAPDLPSTDVPNLETPAHDDDQLTQADSSHAYRIITGAAAEAVAPAISRLEAKIDAMISQQESQTQQPTPPPQQLLSPSSSQRAADASATASKELKSIAAALESSEVNAESRELVRFVTSLAKQAAEASIHAAEAAKKAAEMARDVSTMLIRIGVKVSSTETEEQPL